MKGGGSSSGGTYCRPNMSLKYFHFAQFYGFKKWKIPHAHYQCMCTKCLFCIAKKHTHAQIHAHTSFSAHLVNLSRILKYICLFHSSIKFHV